jgi:hypothetical protein
LKVKTIAGGSPDKNIGEYRQRPLRSPERFVAVVSAVVDGHELVAAVGGKLLGPRVRETSGSVDRPARGTRIGLPMSRDAGKHESWGPAGFQMKMKSSPSEVRNYCRCWMHSTAMKRTCWGSSQEKGFLGSSWRGSEGAPASG